MITVLASAVRTATLNSADMTPGGKGVDLVIDVTAAPGAQTLTPKIQKKDNVSGKYIDVLTGAAIGGVSTVNMRVYPGIAVAANLSASDVLTDTWRVVVTHSAAGNWTYSVTATPLS